MSMNGREVCKVALLCSEVQKLCRQRYEELLQYESDVAEFPGFDDIHKRRFPSTKTSAALRRRSMDLTRALADLRRS